MIKIKEKRIMIRTIEEFQKHYLPKPRRRSHYANKENSFGSDFTNNIMKNINFNKQIKISSTGKDA